MLTYTFGFIGVGNMGGALARAAAKTLSPTAMAVSSRTMEKAQAVASELGCDAVRNETAAGRSHFVFLGVKPQVMPGVLEELSPILDQRKDEFCLVTMAAGLTTERICQMAKVRCPVIRIMPNTPAACGQGMILYARNDLVTEELLAEFLRGLAAAGRFDELPENLIDAGSAVSGCGPAFACQFIEALADGGVACGLPRAKAQLYAAQMLLGAASMVLESGRHPGELKDAVCSPGGTTIQGVRALEERGFRGAVTDAVIAAYEKTLLLAK